MKILARRAKAVRTGFFREGDRWLVKVLAGLIVAGSLARFFVGFSDNPLDHLFSDPRRHWDNAGRLFNPGLMSGCDPIFYQVYLGLLRWATQDNYWGIALCTALLSAAMPWIYYRAGRALGLPRTASLFVWVAMAWFPSFFSIYRYFMMETVLLPLIGVGLWMTGRAFKRKDAASFFIMTAVWGLACLAKSQAVPMAMICWIYALFVQAHKTEKVLGTAGLLFLMLLPNAIRTKGILGYAAPLGSGYIAKIMHAGDTTHTQFYWNGGRWIYSSPSCYIEPLEPFSRWKIGRGTQETSRDVFIERSGGRRSWEEALSASTTGASTWWRHLWENMILFVFAPSWPDSGKDYLIGQLNFHMRWIWISVMAWVLFNNIEFFLRKEFALIPVLTTVMVLGMMFQNSVTTEGRYRKPLEPLLILNFAWACSFDRRSERKAPMTSEAGKVGRHD